MKNSTFHSIIASNASEKTCEFRPARYIPSRPLQRRSLAHTYQGGSTELEWLNHWTPIELRWSLKKRRVLEEHRCMHRSCYYFHCVECEFQKMIVVIEMLKVELRFFTVNIQGPHRRSCVHLWDPTATAETAGYLERRHFSIPWLQVNPSDGYSHNINWLVVWNMAFMTFHILGISSSQSQLTFIFSEG